MLMMMQVRRGWCARLVAAALGVLFLPLVQAELVVELLKDPKLLHGVTQGYANHLPAEERKDCLERWEKMGLGGAQWAFWEISELLHFAHHAETPQKLGEGEFVWETANKAKQFHTKDGWFRMIYDTRQEWREGGRLDLPDQNGVAPKYGDPNTTWPHFLIGQHFAPDNSPSSLLAEEEKFTFDRYGRLSFEMDVKLNRLSKNSEWDHREEYGAPNHAIFYTVFIIMPKAAETVSGAGKIYVLVPTIYSEGGEHVPGSAPWIGIDQFGDGVYFSGSQPALKVGEMVSYQVEVKQLIREALSAATQKSWQQGQKRVFRAEDYMIAAILIGWEVWGGFDTDVEFGNLSFKGSNP